MLVLNHPQHRQAVISGSVQNALLSDTTADTTDISLMLSAEFSPAPYLFPISFLPLWGSHCTMPSQAPAGSCQAPGRAHPCAPACANLLSSLSSCVWACANLPCSLSSQPACRGMLCLWGCSGVWNNTLLINNAGLFLTHSYGAANNSHIHHTVLIETPGLKTTSETPCFFTWQGKKQLLFGAWEECVSLLLVSVG